MAYIVEIELMPRERGYSARLYGIHAPTSQTNRECDPRLGVARVRTLPDIKSRILLLFVRFLLSAPCRLDHLPGPARIG
jgi:hypothetical protein